MQNNCSRAASFARLVIGLTLLAASARGQGALAPRPPDSAAQAKAALAQHTGTLAIQGLHQPVEIVRDTWGVPHIRARDTHDLFFAQGFTVAQDRMWQMELWRRSAEGKLAEVIGPEFIARDKFARALAFRGDWNAELGCYHPEASMILGAFADGVNASIQLAIEQARVPVEFQLMEFQPEPKWTAKTLLSRVPGWALAGSARDHALANLDSAFSELALRVGSNEGKSPSATVPAPRYLVHLTAPGWNAIGFAEPGLPGIGTGHNETLSWSIAPPVDSPTTVQIDDLETDPGDANRFLDQGEWRTMTVRSELVQVKGRRLQPEIIEVKSTSRGPVVWEDRTKHRAYVLRWSGSGVGGASVGFLAAMQAKNEKEIAGAASNMARGFALRLLSPADTTPDALLSPSSFTHSLLTEKSAAVFAIAAPANAAPTGPAASLTFDPKDWDRSTALNAPGQSGQPASPHYADLVPLWAGGKTFPLAFSDAKIAEVVRDRFTLWPEVEHDAPEPGAAFVRVQTELFTDPTPVTVAFGDYDGDGWVDMFVGYRGGMLKLFHNDHGRFVDVSLAAGITDADEVRAAAWGDFDGDGHLDLYVGFALTSSVPNRLYHNDGHGHFVDQAHERGVDVRGETRQVSFVDYDNDGKMDLLVAFREKANLLFHNEGERFREVSQQVGIAGPQSTVGAIWFDYNEDGRLDLFLANQNGSLNRVYRNDGDHFTNVAAQLGLDGAGRTTELGSVSIAAADFNGDGRIDLYYANYGPSWLLRNDGNGTFTDVAAQMGVAVNRHLVSTGWGDYDNDGKPDLYADGYISGHPNIRDYLFHNEGDHFSDATPAIILKHDADHGAAWVDFDRDGALDLVLCDHEAGGVLSVYHNTLSKEKARRSLQVLVIDAEGRYTRAGSEVRLYVAGTRQVLGARLVDTGSGYNSQSAIPVHFGLPQLGKIDVEITTMSNEGRKLTRVANVDPAKLAGQPLVVRTDP